MDEDETFRQMAGELSKDPALAVPAWVLTRNAKFLIIGLVIIAFLLAFEGALSV